MWKQQLVSVQNDKNCCMGKSRKDDLQFVARVRKSLVQDERQVELGGAWLGKRVVEETISLRKIWSAGLVAHDNSEERENGPVFVSYVKVGPPFLHATQEHCACCRFWALVRCWGACFPFCGRNYDFLFNSVVEPSM